MEYPLDLLRKERDKLNNELIEAKIGNGIIKIYKINVKIFGRLKNY
jgi:hypothetical protein